LAVGRDGIGRFSALIIRLLVYIAVRFDDADAVYVSDTFSVDVSLSIL